MNLRKDHYLCSRMDRVKMEMVPIALSIEPSLSRTIRACVRMNERTNKRWVQTWH